MEEKSLDASAESSSNTRITSEQQHIALTRFSGLELRLNTPKGRGVFATQPIPPGTVIDICPVLILSPEDNAHAAQTALYHYSYNWPVIDPTTSRAIHHQALIFGLGSMFNHSTSNQNVVWTRNLAQQTVEYTAARRIEVGEELCISYGGNLWFKDADEGEEREMSEAEVLGGIRMGLDEDEEESGDVSKESGVR